MNGTVNASISAIDNLQKGIANTSGQVEGIFTEYLGKIKATQERMDVTLQRMLQRERETYEALKDAEEALEEAQHEATQRENKSVPAHYYETVASCRYEYGQARNLRDQVERIVEEFDIYATLYKRNQGNVVADYNELIRKSSLFLNQYAEYLRQARKALEENNTESTATATSAQSSGTGAPDVISAFDAARSHGKQSAMAYASGWINGLSPEEKKGIYDYTGNDYYENMNGTLRGLESGFLQGNEKRARECHRALQKSSIPSNCIVYRGCAKATLGMFQDLSDQELKGKCFRDLAFMSTSLNEKKAFTDDLILELLVPKGTPGAYLNGLSQHESEAEVLLDKGRVMKIIDVKTVKGIKTIRHIKAIILV